MPRQLVTLEIHYPLVDPDGDLSDSPSNWPIESALDHYSECQGEYTYTRTVKLVSASPVVYSDADENEAKENGTTLLELGIIR